PGPGTLVAAAVGSRRESIALPARYPPPYPAAGAGGGTDGGGAEGPGATEVAGPGTTGAAGPSPRGVSTASSTRRPAEEGSQALAACSRSPIALRARSSSTSLRSSSPSVVAISRSTLASVAAAP